LAVSAAEADVLIALDVLTVLALSRRRPAARTNRQPCAGIRPLAVVGCPCPVLVADAPHGRGDLPDRDDAVQRAGQHRRLMQAAALGLLETEAGPAQVRAGAEAQRADRERAADGSVPAVRQQDRDHLGGGNFVGTHAASAFRPSERWEERAASCVCSRSSAAISVWPLPSASDSGVPPQRSAGRGSAPAASRYWTTSSWPSAAARCSGVRPS